MLNCDNITVLLSGHLDGELTQQDRQRVEVHLDGCSACRERYGEMSALRSSVRQLAFPQLSDEQTASMTGMPVARASERLGWLLILSGLLIAGGFGVWMLIQELLNDPDVPNVVTLAILAVYGGPALLLLSALLQRLKARRTDRYRNIEL